MSIGECLGQGLRLTGVIFPCEREGGAGCRGELGSNGLLVEGLHQFCELDHRFSRPIDGPSAHWSIDGVCNALERIHAAGLYNLMTPVLFLGIHFASRSYDHGSLDPFGCLDGSKQTSEPPECVSNESRTTDFELFHASDDVFPEVCPLVGPRRSAGEAVAPLLEEHDAPLAGESRGDSFPYIGSVSETGDEKKDRLPRALSPGPEGVVASVDLVGLFVHPKSSWVIVTGDRGFLPEPGLPIKHADSSDNASKLDNLWYPIGTTVSYPEVETNYGRIRGLESAGIHTFRRVPFAAPIAGVRRFLPPSPPEPWTGVRDCTVYGDVVPQMSLPVFSFMNLAGGRPGDDCLSVRIWTPGLDGARRPVLVWIHGGAFLVGSGSGLIYNGSHLAEAGDAVVVTLNYRLGALGYAHLGSIFGEGFEESTNLGVRDQIAALEWVRDHIARFGGDPENVTVFGQSAGGMSIGALLGSPRARALFHRAILMSGAGGQVDGREAAEGVAREFVSRLGGPPPSHRSLAQLSMEDLLRAQAETMQEMSNVHRVMVFLPYVDGDVITEQPLDAVGRGATREIPILTGTTLEEWKLFRALDPGLGPMSWGQLEERFEAIFREGLAGAPSAEEAARRWLAALHGRSAQRSPKEAWCAFQSSRLFHYPCAQLAQAQSDAGGLAHRYLFTWRAPAMRQSVGAAHAIDIPFVFGSAGNPLVMPLTGFGAATRKLETNMQTTFLNFARRGIPGHSGLPAWPEYDRGRRATMILGRQFVVEDAPLEPERALLAEWEGPVETSRVQEKPAF